MRFPGGSSLRGDGWISLDNGPKKDFSVDDRDPHDLGDMENDFSGGIFPLNVAFAFSWED